MQTGGTTSTPNHWLSSIFVFLRLQQHSSFLRHICSVLLLMTGKSGNSVCILPIVSLREKCPYSKFFWSVYSRIRTECERSISSYSVRMRENRDQKNSEYGGCSRSVYVTLRVMVMVCEKTLKSNETRIFAQFHQGRWILPRLRVGAGYFSSWKFAFLKYHRFHLLSDIMLL